MRLVCLRRLPLREVTAPGTPLEAYLSGGEEIAELLGYRLEELERRVAEHPGGGAGEAVGEELVSFNRGLGADAAALAQAERLSDPGTVVVAAGQQVGVLTGPAYTLHKALSLAALARRLEERTGRAVVAVFWLVSDDHDYDEVRSLRLPVGDGLETLELTEGPPLAAPVGPYVPGDEGRRLLESVLERYRGRPGADEVAALLQEAWSDGCTLAEWFARTLLRLTAGSGLVVADLGLPAVARSITPLVHCCIRQGLAMVESARERGERLAALGLPVQVKRRADQLPFYLLRDGRREILRAAGRAFATRKRRYSEEELLELLAAEPRVFSPGVLVRPAAFAAALPTAALVGGPGEAAYHAQLGGVFELTGIPRPAFVPRSGATILTPLVRRLLERFGLTPAQALEFDAKQHLQNRLTRELELPTAEEWARIRGELLGALEPIESLVARIDPTLQRPLEKARERIARQLEGLQERILRAASRRSADATRDAARLAAWIRPRGELQERVLSIVPFLFEAGPELLRFLLREYGAGVAEHLLIDLG
jgi:bacillithiol biosynthesis cysteine-adding enzyme BshC